MEYFGHSNATRKAVIAFMDLFNDLYIEKIRANGQNQLFRVPIQFANRQKWLQQLESRVHFAGDHDGQLNEARFELDMILPRLSVNITGFEYDTSRKIAKTQKIYACEPCSLNPDDHPYVSAPAPWNINIELSAITKNMDDGLQIIEQIVPYFQPSLSVNIKMLDGYKSESVPIVLEGVTPNIDDELEDGAQRLFIWTLNFKMKMNFPMPKKKRGRIKDIVYNIHPQERTADYDQFNQYQLASELFTAPSDSTNYYALTFQYEPKDIVVRKWDDDTLAKFQSVYLDSTYNVLIVKSEGGWVATAEPFYMTGLDGVTTYQVTFRFNVVRVIATTAPEAVGSPQYYTFQEETTGTGFLMAINSSGELEAIST